MELETQELVNGVPTQTADTATETGVGTALMFTPITADAVKPGMTLRFKKYGEPTIVGTVRVEHVHPTRDELVVDAVYRDAAVNQLLFDSYDSVDVLQFAY